MIAAVQKTHFTAGPLTFAVKHELWDGNIQDHPDQGVAITVAAEVAGDQTTLLRFNCFDFEKSYIYGLEKKRLVFKCPRLCAGGGLTNPYSMCQIVSRIQIG